ncbi:hypothetical protein BDZ89DRAFT_1035264 [Hymenopellis radicata]|nr:hypothetical protein BDZ89DRAFT_1035264 [Hymenopellis radicata]
MFVNYATVQSLTSGWSIIGGVIEALSAEWSHRRAWGVLGVILVLGVVVLILGVVVLVLNVVVLVLDVVVLVLDVVVLVLGVVVLVLGVVVLVLGVVVLVLGVVVLVLGVVVLILGVVVLVLGVRVVVLILVLGVLVFILSVLVFVLGVLVLGVNLVLGVLSSALSLSWRAGEWPCLDLQQQWVKDTKQTKKQKPHLLTSHQHHRRHLGWCWHEDTTKHSASRHAQSSAVKRRVQDSVAAVWELSSDGKRARRMTRSLHHDRNLNQPAREAYVASGAGGKTDLGKFLGGESARVWEMEWRKWLMLMAP